MAKIAIISIMANSPWGGSEFLWAVMAEQALSEGHEVFLSINDWSCSHPIVIKLQSLGARLFPRPRFPLLPLRVIKKIYQVKPLIKPFSSTSFFKPIFDSKPDVICISKGSGFDAIYYPDLLNLLAFNSIPYIVVTQFNSDTFSFKNQAERSIAQNFFTQAVSAAFVSKHNLKLAERQMAKSLPNASVIQNPVNLANHSIVDFPSQSTLSLACVARLEAAYKGQDVLFEALSNSVWKQRDWQVCLYGSGPDESYLHELAQHYGIKNRIKFMGHVNDVSSIWANNHLLLLPSRAEGTPLALIEAMLSGRSAVVTDVGGNTEWLEESVTGFIASAPTAKSFGAALERAWQQRENWQSAGLKAHEYAMNKLDKSPGRSLLKLILDATKL